MADSDPLSQMFNLFAAPLAGTLQSFEQFRKGVDEFLRGVENFNRTMENLNETTERINSLVADVEEPLRAAIPQVTRPVKAAAEMEADVVLIDTAGRLQNKVGLMDELGKVKRVIEKQSPVDEVLLVLDATTGQNGLRQAQVFAEVVDVMQTPAFLVRQTSFIQRVARAGTPLNITQGQFLAPLDMGNVVDKCRAVGNDQIMICERGNAPADGPVEVMASLTPPGFANEADTARLFPVLYPTQSISGKVG